ncbi:fimbrial protein [Pseudomonas sp. B21-056]|jgi:major type 1 subunit fimbrin (pilin)|uniref:fimbrial protein n=1 Tax=Pseudomonas sp. B21-056 TaxID=2895495 RepID=UPI00222FE9F8|nr:fimbrial protein [Pseudomonas sp. B21-056]UZE26231.1 fimbrial protein [Pseudomonas sp. B21-056]
MKKTLIAVTLLAGAGVAGLANAADGKINFTGTVTSAACTITPATATQSVALGTVNTSALATVGSVASPTKFSIVLSSCPVAVTSATVKFDGPTDATNKNLLALTAGTGVATGVGVGLYESDATTQIAVGSPSASKPLSASADTTFQFVAKYMATGTVAAGTANAVSDFTVSYN